MGLAASGFQPDILITHNDREKRVRLTTCSEPRGAVHKRLLLVDNLTVLAERDLDTLLALGEHHFVLNDGSLR